MAASNSSADPSQHHYQQMSCLKVPQGFVLKPILLLIYTTDLLWLVESNCLCPHLYADIMLLYGACTAATVDVSMYQQSGTVDAIQSTSAQHSQDRGHMVLVEPTAKSRYHHVTPSSSVRDHTVSHKCQIWDAVYYRLFITVAFTLHKHTVDQLHWAVTITANIRKNINFK